MRALIYVAETDMRRLRDVARAWGVTDFDKESRARLHRDIAVAYQRQVASDDRRAERLRERAA
jgi:hypothetical protein